MTVNSKESPAPAPGSGVVLRASALISGQIFPAFKPLPYTKETLPAPFRRYIIEPEAEDAPPPTARSLTFRTGVLYDIDPVDGRRHERRIQRQVVELERAALETGRLADEIENAPPFDPAIAEILQDNHDADIQLQLKQAEYAAKVKDAADAAAEAYLKEQSEENDAELVSPDVQSYENAQDEFLPAPVESKPKLRRRYVKRGVAWRRAKDPGVIGVSNGLRRCSGIIAKGC